MKIESRNTLLQNDRFILESVRNLIRSSKLNEEVTLEGTNTPEFKEGLVVYFSNIPSNQLDKIDDKLNKNNNKKIVLPQPKNQKFYGTKSFQLVEIAIQHLSEDPVVDQKEITLYNNAISIARLIQSIYKGPVQSDRGQEYDKIRNNAVTLTKKQGLTVWVDKWCPADIFIYNDTTSMKEAQSAKFLNIDDSSLNAKFQSDINNITKGITAISLKEEVARAGSATSFTKNLNRKENYSEAPTLTDQSKRVRSIATAYNGAKNSIGLGENLAALAKIATAHASARYMSKLDKKYPGLDQIISDLELVIKTYFPKLKKNKRGNYESKVILSSPKNSIKDVKLPDRLGVNINKLFGSVRGESEKEYNDSRKTFLDSLKKGGFNVPKENPNSKNLDEETLLKKAGAYLVGSHILDKFNSDKLNIPSEFQTLIRQKNAFVALTAYAIGLAGISPTFFKMIGDSKGKNAKVETFDGSGFINLDEKSEVEIIDSSDNKGFTVKFITKVTLENTKKSKVLKKYKVTMQFAYGGEQIKIEVSELKEEE